MKRKSGPNHYDAIIVGARCAGASTAMLLARQGARVLMIDHDSPGTDTMSTHALMRTAVFQLHRWGLLPAIIAAGTPAIRRTGFVYPDGMVEIDIRPEGGIDALYAPRRYLLDAVLAEAAREAGAQLRFRTAFRSLVRDAQGRVRGLRLLAEDGREEELHADFVIGADGRRSAVARALGARITQRFDAHAACIYRYVEDRAATGNRWHFGKSAAAGIIPTNGGQACVFVAVPPAELAEAAAASPDPLWALLGRHFPELAATLAGAPATHAVTFRGSPGHMREAIGPGWALVGDAGLFRDPITAHGISDAFRDAELLAEAIIARRPTDYAARRDAMAADIVRLTHRIAALDWTAEEIRALHVDLNRAMKANLAQVSAFGAAVSQAA
jgi:flavin-dependent dehydrogenase